MSAASRLITAYREGHGGGKLDFTYSALLNMSESGGNDLVETELSSFFIMPDGGAYNTPDAGNWLFGQAMMRLGFGMQEALTGAQFHHIKVEVIQEWTLSKGIFDAKEDQNSIRNGFNYNKVSRPMVPSRLVR